MMDGGEQMIGMTGWMWAYMLAWLGLASAVLGVSAWAFTRWLDGTRRPIAGGDRALDELRERFARGELNEVEYRERRRVLESDAYTSH